MAGSPKGKRCGVNEYERAICDFLRPMRQSEGLPQAKFGAIAGCSTQQISKFEADENRWSIYRLALIADHFGLPISDLIPPLPERPLETQAA